MSRVTSSSLRTRFGKRLGALKPTALAPINQAMLVFLGLAGSVRG